MNIKLLAALLLAAAPASALPSFRLPAARVSRASVRLAPAVAPGAALRAGGVAAPAAFAARPAIVSAQPAIGADAGVEVTAQAALERAAVPADAAAAPAERAHASARAFDGVIEDAQPVSFGAPRLPMQQVAWRDKHTGQWESEASKIKAALNLALSHPLAAAIKKGLPYNTEYRVEDTFLDNYQGLPVVRTTGADAEAPKELPMIVFNRQALAELSPAYLASRMAAMWANHLYRDTIPVSAERTYIEGSVMARVFSGLTKSGIKSWNSALDRQVWTSQGWRGEVWMHFYNWMQGFQFKDARMGPYFKQNIMAAQGEPTIHVDKRGRMTLYQRQQAKQIMPDVAAAAQKLFGMFLATERNP